MAYDFQAGPSARKRDTSIYESTFEPAFRNPKARAAANLAGTRGPTRRMLRTENATGADQYIDAFEPLASRAVLARLDKLELRVRGELTALRHELDAVRYEVRDIATAQIVARVTSDPASPSLERIDFTIIKDESALADALNAVANDISQPADVQALIEKASELLTTAKSGRLRAAAARALSAVQPSNALAILQAALSCETNNVVSSAIQGAIFEIS